VFISLNLNSKIISSLVRIMSLIPFGNTSCSRYRRFPGRVTANACFSCFLLTLQMLQPPALIIMSIAATRMHRSFQEFVTNELCAFRANLTPFFPLADYGRSSEPKQTSIAPIPLNLEVSVHRPYEAYAPGQHGTYRSYHNMDSPPPSPAQDKSFAPGIDKDPENGVNKAS